MKAILPLILIFCISCTENARVKTFGGTLKFELPRGQKLVNITWKDGGMWYLTKPMSANDIVETYTFQERSNFGVMEGTVIIYEAK